MTIISQDAPRVNLQSARSPRIPIRTYKPDNANVTAAVTYHDAALGVVACSIRSSLGVMRASTSINVDAGVFDRLVADGCQWLECRIKDTNTTYRTRVDTMLQHSQLQQRFGLQRVLHLKYWGVNGDEAEALKPQTPPEPVARQATLFDMPVERRKAGAY